MKKIVNKWHRFLCHVLYAFCDNAKPPFSTTEDRVLVVKDKDRNGKPMERVVHRYRMVGFMASILMGNIVFQIVVASIYLTRNLPYDLSMLLVVSLVAITVVCSCRLRWRETFDEFSSQPDYPRARWAIVSLAIYVLLIVLLVVEVIYISNPLID